MYIIYTNTCRVPGSSVIRVLVGVTTIVYCDDE